MNITEIIDKYEYVSFDLFDTLIFRTFMDYKDVYHYVEYLYNKTSQNPIYDFAGKRINAEKRARKKKEWKEISLDEIYSELLIDNKVKNILKQYEIETEIKNCIPNNSNISFLNELRSNGKKIIITTDMYLPEECIEKILKKCNIKYDLLFLSCAIGKTKESGELYKYIMQSLSITSDKIIHIGDNIKSDYEKPLIYDISAIHYKKKEVDIPYAVKDKKNLLLNHYYALTEKGLASIESYTNEYKLGFSVMGPIMYEFCKWIRKETLDKKIDIILFLAREGYAIKKCYEILFPEDKTKCKYARINKKILEGALKADPLDEKGQAQLLVKYLNNLIIENKKVGLVNNSYSGTGQYLLKQFITEMGYDMGIYGLQFASNKLCSQRLQNNFANWIQNNSINSLRAYLFERGSLIFEHLLFEPNGTAVKLSNSIDGSVEVICETPRLEKKDFDKISEYQNGMLAFVKFAKDNVTIDTKCESIRYFINLIQQPEMEDALMLGKLYDDDTYADRQIINFNIPFKKSILYKNDVYEEISWIQGYMKGKKIPGGYIKLFNIRLILTNILHTIKRET